MYTKLQNNHKANNKKDNMLLLNSQRVNRKTKNWNEQHIQ